MKDLQIDRFCRAVQEFSGAVERIEILFRSIFVGHSGKSLEEPIRELTASVRRLGAVIPSEVRTPESPISAQAENQATWTVRDLATHLRTSPQAIYKMVERRAIPHMRLKRRVIFDPEVIKTWLRDHTVQLS
jgi:hypothetical protein